jgi:hypothetical protein
VASGDGDVLTAVGVANRGLLDEEGRETALGSSSDPERSSVSGGPRDCDSELDDEERGGGGGSGDGGALPEESGSSPMPPSASSLFIKRTVDEVTIRLRPLYTCKTCKTCDLGPRVMTPLRKVMNSVFL